MSSQPVAIHPIFVTLREARKLFAPYASLTSLQRALRDKHIRYHCIGARPYVSVRELVSFVEAQPSQRGKSND